MRSCIFACIAGLANGLAANNIAKDNLGLTSQPIEFALVAHHKTGTHLIRLIKDDIKARLGLKELDVPWAAIATEEVLLGGGLNIGIPVGNEKESTEILHKHLSHVCRENRILLFEDMRPKVLSKLFERCNGARAVHLVRRPSNVVASNWAYTKNLKPGQDRIFDVIRGAILRGHSASWGLQFECNVFFSTYANQMLESHKMIQNRSNILEVRYENLMANYDNTTRSIFEHLFGKTHPSINELVMDAIKYDKNRMPDSVKSANSHISSAKDKADAKNEMIKLHQAGDPCMAKLKESDEIMGYTDPW